MRELSRENVALDSGMLMMNGAPTDSGVRLQWFLCITQWFFWQVLRITTKHSSVGTYIYNKENAHKSMLCCLPLKQDILVM
jgi:hypothetical protein